MHINLDLTDDKIKDFNTNGRLTKDLILSVLHVKNAIEREEKVSLTAEAMAVYNVVVNALDTIDKLLNELEQVMIAQKNGLKVRDDSASCDYKIEHSEYKSSEIIKIEKIEKNEENDDRFCWRVCKRKYDSDLKYYHMNTNGTLSDIINAFEQTKYLIYSAEHTKELSDDDYVSPRRRKARCSIF